VRGQEAPSAPNQRSFTLNSDEFYEAVCAPEERPWIPNGALPREPRAREREVVVEKRGSGAAFREWADWVMRFGGGWKKPGI
jgi:hypothetical protein